MIKVLVSTLDPSTNLLSVQYSGDDALRGHSVSLVVDDGHAQRAQLRVVDGRVDGHALQIGRGGHVRGRVATELLKVKW